MEKKHRLPLDYYTGEVVVAYTICTKGGMNFFVNFEMFSICERKLLEELEKSDCSSLVYLFMPDHCHLLIKGNSIHANSYNCVKMFKQKTGYYFSKNKYNFKWQKDFYDHILRRDEEIQKQVYYILNNPVRNNILSDWKEYEFKGSTEFNFQEWS